MQDHDNYSWPRSPPAASMNELLEGGSTLSIGSLPPYYGYMAVFPPAEEAGNN